MDCFCGCGTKVSRRLVDANMLASRVALELLAWDKARVQGRLGAAAPRLESMIARGENSYGRLLLLLHGDGGPAAFDEAEAWIKDAGEARAGRHDLEDKGTLLSRPRLLLGEEDYELLDRVHPGQSYSRLGAEEAPPAAAVPDVADQLERLGALHAEGVLSDEEFAAAKGRVVGRG